MRFRGLEYTCAVLDGQELVRHLLCALTERRVREGFCLLDQSISSLPKLDPYHPDTPSLILSLSLWTDIGYRPSISVQELLARVPEEACRTVPMHDYLLLLMSRAFCAMDSEDLEEAISLLRFVLRAHRELGDRQLLAVCCFWKGRCHRKRGEYDLAMADIGRACGLVKPGSPKLAAVMEVHESWLLFQKGKTAEARILLDQAEAQLSGTDDFQSLGNIASARGRMARQAGRYSEALEHFVTAVDLYGRLDPNHRNIARALVNAAYVNRSIALQLRKRIDSRAAQLRSRREGAASAAPKDSQERRRYVETCRTALDQLQRAGEIYKLHGHHGGTGAVLVNTGYLHLDGGAVDLAAAEAAKAYELACSKRDHILMARARILESLIENARVEEHLGEEKDVAAQASTARECSEEGVKLAEATQSRLLAAEAHIARGMTAANDFFQDWEEARRCAARAGALLTRDDRDHAWEDLLVLNARILRASGIDDNLRAWSEGMLGGKTFQQVTEEFAQMVIPKVWVREGKKVSRVAQRLAISPKKVRRILRRAGLLRRNGESGTS